jgi:hypothetical protein
VTSTFRSIIHPQRVTSARVQNAAFFRVSDQGFIGETEVRFQRVLGGRQPREVRSRRRHERVICSDSFQLNDEFRNLRRGVILE